MSVLLVNGDALRIPLADGSVHCCVTSPPYWGLRDYGISDQLGLEPTPEQYVANMVSVFREVWRVMRDDGVVFLNLGDSYYSNPGNGRGGGSTLLGGAPHLSGVQRVQSYDSAGKEELDYRDRDYLSRSLHDVRKDIQRFRTLDIPHYHAPKQAHAFCLKILGYMAELSDHFPSGDYSHPPQTERSLGAMLDLLQNEAHAGEHLLSSLVSMPDESFPQPQDRYHLLGSLWAFLSELRSLVDNVQAYAHRLGDSQTTTDGTQGKTDDDALSALRNGYKGMVDACYNVFSWLNPPDIQPYYTTELKPKDLCGIPWRVAFALQSDGWYLRSDVIWNKPNPMPESVTDRPTKSHEYLFLLSKNARYFYDADAVREGAIQAGRIQSPGSRSNGENPDRNDNDFADRNRGRVFNSRNRRTVWTIATAPYSGAHFATFPPALVEPCIKAGTSERGVCPECGAPWERTVERNLVPDGSWGPSAGEKRAEAPGAEVSPSSIFRTRMVNQPITTGWQPTCTHDASPVPAVILDPFAGSGTTLMVARQLGRHGVGLDLSYPYLHDQARERLQLTALEEWTHGKKDGASVADLPLFATQEQQT